MSKKKAVLLVAIFSVFVVGVVYMLNQKNNYSMNGVVIDVYHTKIRIYSDDGAEGHEILDVLIDGNSKLPSDMELNFYDNLLHSNVKITYDGLIADLGPPFITAKGIKVSSIPPENIKLEEIKKYYKTSSAYHSRSSLKLHF